MTVKVSEQFEQYAALSDGIIADLRQQLAAAEGERDALRADLGRALAGIKSAEVSGGAQAKNWKAAADALRKQLEEVRGEKELRDKEERAAPMLADALEELREAWCLNACDAASPDEGLNHLPECERARAALRAAGRLGGEK